MPRHVRPLIGAYTRSTTRAHSPRPKPAPDRNPSIYWAEKAVARITAQLDVLMSLAARDDAAGRALSIEMAGRIRRVRDELRNAQARLDELRAVPLVRRPTINRGPDEARVWIDDDVHAVV